MRDVIVLLALVCLVLAVFEWLWRAMRKACKPRYRPSMCLNCGIGRR